MMTHSDMVTIRAANTMNINTSRLVKKVGQISLNMYLYKVFINKAEDLGIDRAEII